MKQVRVLASTTDVSLEKKINTFLIDNPSLNVIDIRLSGSGGYFCALIIYEI